MAVLIDTPVLDEILRLIRGGVRLLAEGDLAAASEYLIVVDESRRVGPGDLKEALGRYSPAYRDAPPEAREGLLPRVSHPSTMDLAGEQLVLYSKTSHGVAFLEYDLPIDDAWSDLTASFHLWRTSGGYGIELVDLHVL